MLPWMWVSTKIFWDPAFNSFGYRSRSRVAGSYGNSICTFLRNHQTLVHSECTILHSNQQCTRVPTFPHPLVIFWFCFGFFSLVAVSGCEVAFHSVVVCVSLLISDIDRIFMCLLAELAIYLQSELLTLPICSLFIWASFAFVPLNLKSSFLLRVAEHFPDLMEFVISFSDLRLTFRKMEGWGGVKTGSRAHYRGIT